MVPKIIPHAASVVAQNEKDRVRVLGRGAGLKSKRIFNQQTFQTAPPTCPQHVLEKRLRTEQSNCTQGYVAHFRKNHHRLLLGNCNVLTLVEKELELVEVANKNHLNNVRATFI